MNEIKAPSNILQLHDSSKNRDDSSLEQENKAREIKKSADTRTTKPPKERKGTFLIAETKAMERQRRYAEQSGHKTLAEVKARDHSHDEDKPSQEKEGELQNGILQHPYLNSQHMDGYDPTVNPSPSSNSDAKREFDNERRNQEQEKQLRLGNMPKFSSTPTPQRG